MPLEQLIYTSRAAVNISMRLLEEILHSSMRYNRQNGITGMLLYSQGAFVQVLEGQGCAVDGVFAKIFEDQRHRDLIVLERTPVLRRSFGEWTMGFCHGHPANADSLPGYTPFLDSGFTAVELVKDPNFAKNLLHKFAASHRAELASRKMFSAAKPRLLLYDLDSAPIP